MMIISACHVIRKHLLLLLIFFHLPDMGDDTSNIEFADLLRSPGPPSQQTGPPAIQDSERTLDDILAQSSTDLIRAFASSIKQGAVREASKTEEFQQGKTRIYAEFC